MEKIDKLIKREIVLLYFATPMVYAVAKVIRNKSLYVAKDVLMAILCLQILIVFALRKIHFNARWLFLIFIYFTYILIDSMLKMDNEYIWLISMREMVVTPLMLIIIGIYLNYIKIDFLEHSRKILYFTTFLTVVFSFIFRDLSYGGAYSLYSRLSSFWDREHEPAFVGAMLIIATISQIKRDDIKPHFKDIAIPVILGSFCMIMSKSRSAIAAFLGTLIYVFADRVKLKNIIAISLVCIGCYIAIEYYSIITHRALDHNTGARTSQWTMAYNLFDSNPLFGIGTDKYGVLSGLFSRRLTFQGASTTTMDSSLIKYLLNLGLFFAVLFFSLLKKTYKTIRKYDRYVYAFIIFGLLIGAVTGKLAAYPMNQYFFPIIGYCLLSKHLISNKR